MCATYLLVFHLRRNQSFVYQTWFAGVARSVGKTRLQNSCPKTRRQNAKRAPRHTAVGAKPHKTSTLVQNLATGGPRSKAGVKIVMRLTNIFWLYVEESTIHILENVFEH